MAGYSQFLKDPGYAIDDAPPAPLLSNETDLLTIDEALGNYDPQNQIITLFQPNIQKAAHILECDEWDLTYVTRYHEYAHAAIHLAVTAEDHLKAIHDKRSAKSRLRALTRSYSNISPCVHEHLTRLVTYHVLKRVSESFAPEIVVNAAHRMLDVFNKLMRRQPASYRVDCYLGTPHTRLNGTIRLIKEESLAGTFTAWKNIMELD